MKMYGKRMLVLFLVLILALGSAACSTTSQTSGGKTDNSSQQDNSSNKTEKTEKKKEPVTLKLLSHYVAHNEEFLKTYVDQWNAENPDIQIVLEGVEFNELLPTIMTKQTSGQGADITHIYSLWAGQLDKSGVIAKAPDDVISDIKANYPEPVAEGVSVDGNIFGYPTEVQPFALYYNKRLLKDAGFNNPPTTWDELLSMAEAMNKTDKNGNSEVQGFAFIRAWPAIVYHPFVALMSTAGGQFIEDGKVNLDSEAAKKTMELYTKVHGKDGLTEIGNDIMKGFAAEQVAMTINAGWWAGSLKVTMEDAYENVGVAPIPSPDGKTKGSVSYTWGWTVNSKSKHQEEAWKFLKWFNSQQVKDGLTPEGNFLLEAFNTISTRKSDQEADPIKAKLASDANLQTINQAIKYATPEPNPAAGAEIQNILFKQIDSVWTGQITPEKALEIAQQEIQAKLK
jgi:multiple sugar transport system substrate-binding protein